MTDRLCAGLLVAALAGACASAPRARSFQDLPTYLDRGNTINLTETTGQTMKARLEALSPTSLTILTAGILREVPENHVSKIGRPERWTGRGALIGLGVGFGVGLLAGRTGDPSGNPLVEAQLGVANVAGGMLIGAAVGAIVGAVTKVNRTLYVAPVPPRPQAQSHPHGLPVREHGRR